MPRRVLTIFAVAVLGTLIAAVSVTALHRSGTPASSDRTVTSR